MGQNVHLGFLLAWLLLALGGLAALTAPHPLHRLCPQEPASPAAGGVSHLFKGLSGITLFLSLASAHYPFAPSLPVAALAVVVGSLAIPAAHRSRTDTLLVWLFTTAATACALTQTVWLLWYGPAHILRQPTTGGVPTVGVFTERADALQAFFNEVQSELDDDAQDDFGDDWTSKATNAAAAMHLALTVATTLLLAMLACLSSARLKAVRQVTIGSLLMPPTSSAIASRAMM